MLIINILKGVPVVSTRRLASFAKSVYNHGPWPCTIMLDKFLTIIRTTVVTLGFSIIFLIVQYQGDD